jgi:aryl-alcohol dehydrogenase-like predicted oxidoreductase
LGIDEDLHDLGVAEGLDRADGIAQRYDVGGEVVQREAPVGEHRDDVLEALLLEAGRVYAPDAMVGAREDCLIGGVGLSNVSLDRLRAALRITGVVCVQNSFSPLDRGSAGVQRECARGASRSCQFVPLGFPRPRRKAIPSDPVVGGAARALDLTPAQVVLAWLAAVSPNVLLIPGTSSMRHLEENLAVSRIELAAPTLARLEDAFGRYS